ncbi:MAG: hypothetical protein HZA93_23105 [Verrucomicrobia bacterium]|nr:hypothetical protein [Verrucomicrobiota bacterium]
MTLATNERRQLLWISLGAMALFVGFRFLPTGTNLSHMDFRVTAKNPIDFCDPLSPQFIPVVAMASPVAMTVAVAEPATAGKEVRATVRLRTANGKAIASEDLLVSHTRKLHLLVIDPTLTDYQHLHPTPGRVAGDWEFSFTPRLSGQYRVFADFTPAATGRGLYANGDLKVAGSRTANEARPGDERRPYTIALTPAMRPMKAKWPTDLKLTIAKNDGGPVPMEPVMGAYAHLVAFDETRSGFAHLHPVDPDLEKRPDSMKPALDFKITIPKPGRYVIWAQVSLGGREVFEPFWFEVVE